MTTLSIILPDNLAEASQRMAEELGLSRTEFIRRAIKHEIKQVKAKMEEQAMAKSLLAMKQDMQYSQLSDEITTYFVADLPDEEDDWWNKKS